MVLYCNYIRAPGNLPKAGCRELLELCRQYFGVKFTLGRDRFFDVLRANSLMLRRKRCKPRTTDSNHNNRIYPDLLNTTPKLVARHAGHLVVADITYVCCSEGFGYLSLLTDAFTRYIVGWRFHETLETDGPAQALTMAIKARISMTQTGDPLHNALAERMNNTVKNSWLFNNGELDFVTAGGSIANAIRMYNTARPHQSLDMRTPYEMMAGHPDNPLLKHPLPQR